VNPERAVAAATTTARELGLTVDDAVVLQASNRVTLRLAPCDVVVRVAPGAATAWAERELMIGARLAAVNGPAERPADGVEQRAHRHDDLALTFWRYHEHVPPPQLEPAEYADVLARLHDAYRTMDDATSHHFTDRVAEAERTLTDDDRCSPDVTDAERELVLTVLRVTTDRLVGRPEQLLHGEPHPGNVIRSKDGLLFVDLETCCRGPIELDLAHADRGIEDHYPGVDLDALATCRTLARAVATAWRCDRNDLLPNGPAIRAWSFDRLRKTR
jgi:hypothetical protein